MTDDSIFFYYNKGFVKLLNKLNITLVFSTYQAGRVIFISSPTGEAVYKYAKNFKRPMGIDVHENKLAIASRNFIEIYSRANKLGPTYPEKPNFYDSLYTPQVKYYTGITDMHEITWDNNEIWAVNTSFSCISRMSDDYHFIPAWKPDFITELEPEDRCHLNGLVVKEGEPKYVTFFAKTDEANGWRKGGFETGMLYDAQQQKPVLDKLPMPHSPIYWNNSIYFLLSATGEVVKYDIEKQESKVIAQVDSFLRGLDIYDHYLFVGASKMRETSKSFKDLPIAKKSFAGIIIIDMNTGETVGSLTYTDRISEIFSVRVITNMKLPILLSEKDEGYEKCIHCGDDLNYWLVDEEKNDTKE